MKKKQERNERSICIDTFISTDWIRLKFPHSSLMHSPQAIVSSTTNIRTIENEMAGVLRSNVNIQKDRLQASSETKPFKLRSHFQSKLPPKKLSFPFLHLSNYGNYERNA